MGSVWLVEETHSVYIWFEDDVEFRDVETWVLENKQAVDAKFCITDPDWYNIHCLGYESDSSSCDLEVWKEN